MEVLSVAAQKGGTGKTTACQCLAVEALMSGFQTAIIDGDPQGNALDWHKLRSDKGIRAPLVVKASRDLQAQVSELEGRGVQLLIIDTPPSVLPVVNNAFELSTAALIVTRPGFLDLKASVATWRITQSLGVPTAVVLWQVPSEKILAMARKSLAPVAGDALCPEAISRSIAWEYGSGEGLTPQERDPKGQGRAEIASLWAWMQKRGLLTLRHEGHTTKASTRKKRVSV